MSANEHYSLHIDCPPGGIRPGDLLDEVLANTGVKLDKSKPNTMIFGDWGWNIPQNQTAHYVTQRDVIASRLKALYEQGIIRYAEW